MRWGKQIKITLYVTPDLFFFFSFGLGASGVGRSHIKNTLLNKYPDKFGYPVPCMSAHMKPTQYVSLRGDTRSLFFKLSNFKIRTRWFIG